MCVRVCLCVHVWGSVWLAGGTGNECWVSSCIALHLSICEMVSPWSGSSLVCPDWLADKPQGCSCLCVPRAGIRTANWIWCWCFEPRSSYFEQPAHYRMNHPSVTANKLLSWIAKLLCVCMCACFKFDFLHLLQVSHCKPIESFYKFPPPIILLL